MGRYMKTFIALTFVVTFLNFAHGYAIPSSMDPIDRCIYLCIHCFKDYISVICANECLATESKMHKYWFKTCPQLSMPYFYMKELELDDKELNSEGTLDNKIHYQ